VQLAIPVVGAVLVLHAVLTNGPTVPGRTAQVDEKYGAGVICGQAVVFTKSGEALTAFTAQVPNATAVGPLVSGLHAVVFTKFGDALTAFNTQVPGGTGTSVVTIAAGHVVVMNGPMTGTPEPTQVPGETASGTFMVCLQIVCVWWALAGPVVPVEVVPTVQLAKKVAGVVAVVGPGQSLRVKLLAILRELSVVHVAAIGTPVFVTCALHVAR